MGDYLDVIDHILESLFLLDVCLRIVASWRNFFFGKRWATNIFDMAITSVTMVNLITGELLPLTVLRVVRMITYLNEVELIKVLFFTHPLRQILNGWVSCFPLMMWCVGSFLLATYLGSLI